MRVPKQEQARGEVLQLLAELLGTDVHSQAEHAEGLEGVLSLGDRAFLAEYRAAASASLISSAIARLRDDAKLHAPRAIPLIVVPYMGSVGRELCEAAGLSWVDLSGNAKIDGPRLRIWIEGRPNRFVSRGRPPNLFAPKSSRITRQLLLDSGHPWTQVELARATGLDDGYVSKIVRRLKNDGLVVEDPSGSIKPSNPDILLDAWHSVYEFDRHRIVKGHVSARSGEALMRGLAEALERAELDYAVTGLGAAWLMTHFASFRLVRVYLHSTPPRALLKDMGFWDEERGANTWLAIPNDSGVFHGGQMREGVHCVSAIQTFLDLKGHDERSKEAADELRRTHLDWKSNG